MTNFKIGDTVVLYPGDTHIKIAEIIHIGEHGWEFKILKGTSEKADVEEGVTYFISHSKPLSMVLVKLK